MPLAVAMTTQAIAVGQYIKEGVKLHLSVEDRNCCANNMTVRISPLMGRFLGTHHQVLEVLGEGSFSVVVKCCNLYTKKMEAVKVFRHHHDADVALREVNVLQRLRRLDPDKSNIIRWNSSYSSEPLTWISFELLDQDLRKYVKSKSQITKTMALPVAEVRPILLQLITALYYLKTVRVVHADLKPDNILCVECNQQPIRVKLADFGLAQFSDNINTALPVQSLCYRAPEVLVGCIFDEAIDMWSLGATAAELVLGTFLYGVNNEYDALRAIIETQGQPPDDMLDQGKFSCYYFEKRNKSLCRWRIKTPEVFQRQTGHRSEKKLQVLGCLDDIVSTMEQTHGLQEGQHQLMDLISEMLSLDPKDRIDPANAFNHQFFSEKISTPRDCQQEDIQECQTSDFQQESETHIQLENSGFHNDIPGDFQREDRGPVQPHVAGCYQMANYECAQQEVPAVGLDGPWMPGYYQENSQYLPYFAPIQFAYVQHWIPACNPAANGMYVAGNYNMGACGCYQPKICKKPSGEEPEHVSLKKKAKRLYQHRVLK